MYFFEFLIPIIVTTVPFATIFGIVYMYLATRHKERLLLIEKGIDVKTLVTERKPMHILFKLGLLCIGVGVGIFIGYILHKFAQIEESVAYPSMIFLCAGIALVLSFIIEKRLNK
jgi:hypothetical protein